MTLIPPRPDLGNAFGRYEAKSWRLPIGTSELIIRPCGWLLGIVIDASDDDRALDAHVVCALFSRVAPAQVLASGGKHAYRDVASDNRIIVLGLRPVENKSSADPFALRVQTDIAFVARVMQLQCEDLPPRGQLACCNLRPCTGKPPP